MKRILILSLCLGVLACAPKTPPTKTNLAPPSQEAKLNSENLKTNISGTQKTVVDASKRIKIAAKAVTGLTPESVTTQKAPLANELNSISTSLDGIDFKITINFVDNGEKLDSAKDLQINQLITKVDDLTKKLEDNTDKMIKNVIGVCSIICFLAFLGFAIFAFVAKKFNYLVPAGLSLVAFTLCIGALKYFIQLSYIGGAFLLAAMGLAIWHLYKEWNQTNTALTTTVATANILKQNLNPATKDDVLNNQVANLQAASGVQDKITAVRAAVDASVASTVTK